MSGVFGDKRPFTIDKVWRDDDGVKWVRYSADFWEGPVEAGQTGAYRRLTSTIRDLGSVSPNVSFYRDLEKHFPARTSA